MSYVIINNYIPQSLYPLKAPYTMTPQYITIHNTANDASAMNEIAYMHRNKAATSYHVAIDDQHAVQAIPFSRNAWHAGDGSGKGNRASIGIEICYSKSGGEKYRKAEANAIEYVAHVLHQYGWGIDRVKWHKDWSGKNCPHRILDEGRASAVKQAITAKLNQLKSGKQVASVDKKEDEDLKFSSGAAKSLWETMIQSKAQREIVIQAAVNAGYSETWIKDLEEGKVEPGDFAGLMAGTIVKLHKQNK
ncbi:peptidoglycan recognition protein family protein [Sporosarcina newyorkensis]|uniref:peptidoglycan recognition protein family protein n=1 Tax=Sporosarcina newyorkensis TaxID=759851 RepID=UPI003CFD04FE